MAAALRRMLLMTILMLALCAVCVVSAHAASIEMNLRLFPTEDASSPVYVAAIYERNKYTLCVPASWDLTKACLRYSTYNEIRIDNLSLHSGSVVDLTPWIGQQGTIYNDRNQILGAFEVLQGSEIPSVFFTVDPEMYKVITSNKDREITEGSLSFFNGDGSVAYSGALAQLKGHGNATFGQRKKPYQFKLEKKTDLCGMGKDKTWILLADFYDRSLLRNRICLDLAASIGLPYAVECSPCDVYINGDYMGLYLLTEKVQIGKGRVEITDLEEATEKLNTRVLRRIEQAITKHDAVPELRYTEVPVNPPDITGGYLLIWEKSHRFKDANAGFLTNLSMSMVIKEPTYPSQAQASYIANLWNHFHRAVCADNGTLVVRKQPLYYADYIDMLSFARKFLLEDFVRNYDAQGGSMFFFKDADSIDSKIYAGPGWDYDLTFGNANVGSESGHHPAQGQHLVVVNGSSTGNLWAMLWKHKDFRQVCEQQYLQRLQPCVRILLGEKRATPSLRVKPIDAYVEEIRSSAAMNNVRWPGGRISGVYAPAGSDLITGAAYLKDYIAQRLAYLDAFWAQQTQADAQPETED